MADPSKDLFDLLREDGLEPATVRALDGLPRGAQARLGSRILELIEHAVSGRLEAPPGLLDGKEVWWIASHRDEPWAGLRIATFIPTRQECTLVVIQGESDPRRIGVRIWDDIYEREGWRKIERIPVPVIAR